MPVCRNASPASIRRRALGVVGVGLTLIGGPPAAPAQTAPAPARMAPQARALIDRAVAAHQALKTLTATLEVRDAAVKPQTRAVALAFQKPRRVRVDVFDDKGLRTRSVCDGRGGTTYDRHEARTRSPHTKPAHEARIGRQPFRPDGGDTVIGTFQWTLNQAGAALPTMLARPEGLIGFFGRRGLTATLGPPARVGGVLADSVNITLVWPEGDRDRIVLSFGCAGPRAARTDDPDRDPPDRQPAADGCGFCVHATACRSDRRA